MKNAIRQSFAILMGLFTLFILIGISADAQTESFLDLEWLVFTILIFFTSTFGIPLGGGEVSISPMITMAILLALGLAPAGWAALTAAILYGIIRFFRSERESWDRRTGIFPLIGTTAANITMHTASILLSGSVYTILGGAVPIPAQAGDSLFPLISMGAIYITSNYLIASVFIGLRGREYLANYMKHIPNLLLYEIPPIFFAPLTAQIFEHLGFIQFVFFAISLVAISIVLRDQARTHHTLERRVQELSSLQIVGQTLSTSLEIEVIAGSIYTEVSKLMPAANFYLALFNKETNEVSFPLAYEFDEKKQWRPRATGNGLTEYILNSKSPLLIENNVAEKMGELGIQMIGQEALSWLGVPIMAGGEGLGVIAVQSYPLPNAIPQRYDSSHQEILITIAAQASAAIQNARLYTQTDESLAQRVQELNSVLSTTHEGLLLVDQDLKVLAANPALADFLGVTQLSLLTQQLSQPDPQTTNPLIEQIGFTHIQLESTLKSLSEGKHESSRETIFISSGDTEKPLDRVVTPVFGDDNSVNGWLFVFRDLTEEHQLFQLREDLTRMLVHDLRSPIVSIRGGLDMIEMLICDGETDDLLEMIQISKSGSDQMLDMINELLNISKLEIGEMPLTITPTNIEAVILKVSERLSPIAKQCKISINPSFPPELPLIEADQDLIKRVIHNILDNALKFTPDEGQINISAESDLENNDFLHIRIKDSGPGIPELFREKLFQKYQTESSSKERRKGTGIGLYFCKLAVEAHNGEIWAESELGMGTTISIRLPINFSTQ